MYLDNKYTRWYYSIIKNSPNIKIAGETERHHITPKSMGGKDRNSNFVHVTVREHFILHKLLTKMTIGFNLSKMWLALRQMSTTRNYKLPSREYARIKSMYIPHQSSISKEINNRPEHKAKMKVIQSSEAYSKLQTEQKIANWADPEYRTKQETKRNSVEFKEKLSAIRKKSCDNKEFSEWARELHTKSWKVKHKNHTNDSWIKIENVKKFCEDNGLNQGNMGSVSRGERKQHKGWQCIKIDDNGFDIINEFIPKIRPEHTEETKRKISEIQKGKKRKPHSTETINKLKIAAANREIRNKL